MEDEVRQTILADVAEPLELRSVNEMLHHPSEALSTRRWNHGRICSLVPELLMHGIPEETWPTHGFA
jgi:hypothetical protein